MFPIKSLAPSGRFPFVTWLLIISNTAVFLYMWKGGLSSVYFIDYGIVPAKLGVPGDVVPLYEKIYPFVTYMFIHGGWLHLILNVYFLYIFGDNVEYRLGHLRYLFSYAAFGLIGAVAYVFLSPTDGYPVVGASGAVAGVMGAYIVFFPTAKVKTLLIIIIFITVANIPAVVFIGLWFLIQICGALFDVSAGEGGVAWRVHVGGFAAGAVFAVIARVFSFFKNAQA